MWWIVVALLFVPAWTSAQECRADLNGNGATDISDLVAAVNEALEGCGAAPTPGPRFVDNGDGTVTDNLTGLDWEKKTELDGANNFANLHDADNSYTWAGTCSMATSKRCQPTAAAAALCTANAENGSAGCDECTGDEGTCRTNGTVWQVAADLNTASFGGHTDWRVPTRAELISIVDYADTVPPLVDVAFAGVSCGGACTDVTDPDCSCTQSSFGYWSASTLAPVPANAWLVLFDNGLAGYQSKSSSYFYVRVVRGGS